MKNYKIIAFSLLLCSVSTMCFSQVKIPVTNNDLRTNLQKVVSDFPKHFSNLKGQVLNQNPQTVEYASLLEFEMAPENIITEYKGHKPIFSWQAMLLRTESFEEASKKYKWLCNQLKVMSLTIDDRYSFSLSGYYDEPDESKVFSSSIYKLTPQAAGMPKIKIEAGLQFEFPEWKVQLLVYEKEREDDERGDIEE